MVNPHMAHEHRTRLTVPAAESRKVLVVGGGVAGMEAAMTASDSGHRVVLIEKSDVLGGVIKFADHDSIKVQLKKYKDYLIRQVTKRKIDIRLGTEASEEIVNTVKPDAIIVATGAKPIRPKIPGIDRENVMYAADSYYYPEKVGKKVVMIGGGLVGCEVGSHLANVGHSVEILEMGPELAPEDNGFHHCGMMAFWEDRPIQGHTGMKVTKITEEGVCAETKDGRNVVFEADTVLYSVGSRADTSVTDEMRKYCYDVVPVGDCLKSGRIVDAVGSGYHAAVDLA